MAAGGVETMRKFQIGKETTAGTAVATTTVMRGWGSSHFDPGVPRNRFEPEDGMLITQTGAWYDVSRITNLPVDSHPATFEQLKYWFAAGIEGTTTGTRDGTAGTGYVYQYDLVTNARQVPLTYTIEGGDNQRVDEMEYSYVEEFTLSGAKGGEVELSGTWRGRQLTDSDFTASQIIPATLDVIKFGKCTPYVDTAGGTIGDTSKPTSLLAFDINIVTGHVPIYAANGAVYFEEIDQTSPKVTGTLTWRHDATGEAELTSAKTPGTVRQIRLLIQGAALATAGAAYTYKTLKMDMAIEYTEIPSTSADDMIDQIELPFEVVWLTAKSLGAQFIVVDENATYT